MSLFRMCTDLKKISLITVPLEVLFFIFDKI